MREDWVSQSAGETNGTGSNYWRESLRSAAWLRGNILVGLIFVCIYASACSSDKAVNPSALMISDVGVQLSNIEFDDGTVGAFRYEGIVFEGDIQVVEYREAAMLASEIFIGEETIMVVANYRVFPQSVSESRIPPRDFSIYTCATPFFDECGESREYLVSIEHGNMEVSLSKLEWLP